MKSKLTLVLLLAALFAVSCRRGNDNISIRVTDTGSRFDLNARYPGDKTGRLGRYINRSIGPNRQLVIQNGKIDATTTLNDDTHFRVRLRPGKLEIQFNKSENSEESYQRMVKMYDDIKRLLTDPD